MGEQKGGKAVSTVATTLNAHTNTLYSHIKKAQAGEDGEGRGETREEGGG